jgi:hypothetical protein
MVAKAKNTSFDINDLSPEEAEQLQKLLNKKANIAAPPVTPQDSLSVVKNKTRGKIVETKKRVRTRRMHKVNGLTMLMFLHADEKHIVLQCLEDMADVLTLPLDWALAKKAAKVLANYVKAKRDLQEYQSETK